MKRIKKLRAYAYEFEWNHHGANYERSVLHMKVVTPRSHDFVSHQVGAATVFALLTDEPFARITNMPVQHAIAVAEEIRRERHRLLVAKRDAERVTKTGAIQVSDILNHPTKSLRAEDYLEVE